MKLSQRSVEDVCELITRATDIGQESAVKYTGLMRANNISGKVLLHCDLNELKAVSVKDTLKYVYLLFILNNC